jgi:hypothetical protein
VFHSPPFFIWLVWLILLIALAVVRLVIGRRTQRERAQRRAERPARRRDPSVHSSAGRPALPPNYREQLIAAGQYQWFTGQLTEMATASGSELRAQLFRDSAMTQPAGIWVYRLDGDELRLISQEPWPALVPLAEAFEGLFRRGQPEQALAALARYDPSLTMPPADGYSLAWRTAMARYLTALALDYAGRADEARVLLTTIAQEYPDTGWAVLAQEGN